MTLDVPPALACYEVVRESGIKDAICGPLNIYY